MDKSISRTIISIGKLLLLGFVTVILFIKTNCNPVIEPDPIPAANNKIVLGYYWPQETYHYSMIKYENLTHVALAFAIPKADGTLNTDNISSQISGFVETAHQYRKKAILSVGGYTGSSNFSGIASDAGKRQIFASTLKTFCISNNYDGVDIDWEFPNTWESYNVTNLIKEIYNTLKSGNSNLTISITIPYAIGWTGFDITGLKNYVDWIGVMTYDYSTCYSSPLIAGHNAPFSKIKSDINNLLGNVPPEKLLLGLPFYGRQYNCLSSPSINAIANGCEDMNYSNLPDFFQGSWQRNWDNNSSAPYLTNSVTNQLISYDDQQSIKLKCQWLNEKNLKGAIIWALGKDGLEANQPLLCTVGKEILGTGCTAANLNGIWNGILTQPGNTYDLFNFQISILQNSETITGTSRIEVANTSYFGIMTLSGDINGNNLNFLENTIQNQNPPPGFIWCIKMGDLLYKETVDSLIGHWSAPGCLPGMVKLHRVSQ
jgi:chitinase